MRTQSSVIVAAVISIVAVASCAKAHAYTYGERTTTINRHHGTVSVKSEGYTFRSQGYARPAVTEVGSSAQLTAQDIVERDARIAKWEAFCAPVGEVDALGVTRLRYKYAGCEFGRSE